MDNLEARLQRAEMKNQALLQALQEKVSNLTTSYENQVADLRVELTITSQQLERLKSETTPEEVTPDSDNADSE